MTDSTGTDHGGTGFEAATGTINFIPALASSASASVASVSGSGQSVCVPPGQYKLWFGLSSASYPYVNGWYVRYLYQLHDGSFWQEQDVTSTGSLATTFELDNSIGSLDVLDVDAPPVASGKDAYIVANLRTTTSTTPTPWSSPSPSPTPTLTPTPTPTRTPTPTSTPTPKPSPTPTPTSTPKPTPKSIGLLKPSTLWRKGSTKVGKTVSIRAPKPNTSGVTVTYQWYAGSTKIKGAIHSKLTFTKSLKSRTIYVNVTYAKPGYATRSLRYSFGKVK
jgi:hypothetical protein